MTMIMDGILQSLLLAILVHTIIISLQYYRRRWPVANFPPGPTGIPIIGTALSTGKAMFQRATRTQSTMPHFGKVFSLMLDEPVVIVNGYEAIREVTHGSDFVDRVGSMYSIQSYNPKLLGFFSANFTETFHRHRRFVLSSLRRFGFGKASFEGIISREVNALLNHISSLPKMPQDLALSLSMSVCSTLCDFILGCHYEHNDVKFQRFVHVMDALIKFFWETEMFLMNFFPMTRPFFQHKVKEMQAIADELDAFTMGKVEDRLKTFVPGNEPYSFLDCYLEKMTKEPENYTMEELRFVLSDLLIAASDTSSNMLSFAILYMVVNPDVQEKVHEELIRVVGPSRLPTLEDRDRLTYTVATIHETQRLGNVRAVLPRCATVDTTLAGYAIPKRTRLVCDLWGLHYDPELWPEPEKFEPMRHIGEDGKVIKSPHLLPFRAGRRSCIGESFARMQLFLFFSSMMHRFKFQVPAGATKPSLDHQPGFTASPKPFKVMITQRAAEIPA